MITRCAIVAFEAAATEHDKNNIRQFVEEFCTPPTPSEAVVQENVLKHPTKTPAEVTARINILEAANTRVRLALEIQVLRVRTCQGDNRYSNFQFATRSVLPIVTNFFSSLLAILTSQAEGELRYGMPPRPTPCSGERSLKKLLADMGDVDDNNNW